MKKHSNFFDDFINAFALFMAATIVILIGGKLVGGKATTIPDVYTYSVQIVSTDADDVDINTICASDGRTIGTGNTFVTSKEDDVIFYDGYDFYRVECNTGRYVPDEDILKVINDLDSRRPFTGCLWGNYDDSVDYSVKQRKVRDNDYGIETVSVYTDKSSGNVGRVVADTSDGVAVIVNLIGLLDLDADGLHVGGTHSDMVEYTIAEMFTTQNIYIKGKYKIVDYLIDSYNIFLGGQL